MDKLKEYKKQLKELEAKSSSLLNERNSCNKEIQSMKDKIHELENEDFYEFCNSLKNEFINLVCEVNEFVHKTYLSVDSVSKKEDEYGECIISGACFELIYKNNELVACYIDNDAQYTINSSISDVVIGFYKKENVTVISESEFLNAYNEFKSFKFKAIL